MSIFPILTLVIAGLAGMMYINNSEPPNTYRASGGKRKTKKHRRK